VAAEGVAVAVRVILVPAVVEVVEEERVIVVAVEVELDPLLLLELHPVMGAIPSTPARAKRLQVIFIVYSLSMLFCMWFSPC
jgi:hypothetical protein